MPPGSSQKPSMRRSLHAGAARGKREEAVNKFLFVATLAATLALSGASRTKAHDDPEIRLLNAIKAELAAVRKDLAELKSTVANKEQLDAAVADIKTHLATVVTREQLDEAMRNVKTQLDAVVKKEQ